MDTEGRSELGVRSSEEMLKEHVIESQAQLAETIAKMAEGIIRTHNIFLPRGVRMQFEAKALQFIKEAPGITEQIEEQLRKSMTRPPAA